MRDDGQPADLDSLPLSPDLRDRLRQWNSRYDDSRLPFDQNDVDWLTEGRILLADTRADLGEAYDIVATEPWWGEEPGPLALPSQS